MTRKPRHSITTPRRAAATLELAVCLPVIVTLVLGTIEAANSIFLKQSLTIAAYESARIVTAPDGTYSGALKRARQVLEARKIDRFRLRVLPANYDRLPAGSEITVIVTTRANANSISPSWYDKRALMSATVRMAKF